MSSKTIQILLLVQYSSWSRIGEKKEVRWLYPAAGQLPTARCSDKRVSLANLEGRSVVRVNWNVSATSLPHLLVPRALAPCRCAGDSCVSCCWSCTSAGVSVCFSRCKPSRGSTVAPGAVKAPVLRRNLSIIGTCGRCENWWNCEWWRGTSYCHGGSSSSVLWSRDKLVALSVCREKRLL